ncbi:MAG: hypothetical protein RLZZ323_1486 [Bacteroidota bacterium]
MPYSIIIVIHLVFGILIELKTPKKNLFGLYMLIVVSVILLAGLRGAIEGDYLSYYDIFKSSITSTNKELIIEPLYFLFNKFINNLGLNFQIVIIIMAVISVIPKYRFFFRESPNFGFTAFIYFCTVYFIFDFIQIRQAVTISLFIIALKFVIERKIIPYIIIVLFATLIHYSAIILLPGYYLFNRDYRKGGMYLIILICGFINIMEITTPFLETILTKFGLPTISSDKILAYSQSTVFSAVSIKQLILGLLFIFAFKEENSSSSYHRILLNLFVFGVLFGTLFNGISEVAFRVKWYFFWTESLLVVFLIERFSFGNFLVKIVSYTIVAVFYINSLYLMLDEFSSRGPYIFPYRTYLND